MKGLFITIEGIDGAGKSTQINLLSEYLKNTNKNFIITREPGGTDISEKIRKIILDNNNNNMNNITETILYAASRAQHIQEKIKPALTNGKIVICDRFVDSSIAYQVYARNISLELVENINKYATENIEPDITIYLDLLPAEAIKRKKSMQKNLDRIENENLEFYTKVYNGYQNLLTKYPQRIKKIKASKSIDEIHKEIINYINTFLERG